MIPQFSLVRQNKFLDNDLQSAIGDVIKSGRFVLGPKVEEFESAFAKYLRVKYAVGVASGTDALSLALLAIGVERGDEVILPANAYPTAFAVTAIGAIPRLVDIDPATFNINPMFIPSAINKKTKAIIAVHLYGQPADMESILTIGKKYNIPIVEDCAQAHGAEIRRTLPTFSSSQEKFSRSAIRSGWGAYHPSSIRPSLKSDLRKFSHAAQKTASSKFYWKKVGSIGEVGCFSFYPTKNLSCFGDGGMVVTNNKEIYEKVRMLRMYGEKERYNSILLGRNSRLDELQSAVLLVKLKYLDKWNERRREIAQLYNSRITRIWTRINSNEGMKHSSKFEKNSSDSGIRGIQLPLTSNLVKHVYHLFVIRSKKRDQLKIYLEKHGVQTAIHYPTPIHLQPSFKFLGYKKGDFPEVEAACKEILSLPMFPELRDEEVETVADTIRKFLISNY